MQSPSILNWINYEEYPASLAQALDLTFLMIIPRVFIYLSLLAWVLAFRGMLITIVGKALSVRA